MQFVIAALIAVGGFLLLRLSGGSAPAPKSSSPPLTVTAGATRAPAPVTGARVSSAAAAEARITKRATALLATWGVEDPSNPASRDLVRKAVGQAALEENTGDGVEVIAAFESQDITAEALRMLGLS